MNHIITNCNHNHKSQLGILQNLCDDVIYITCDFLTNDDIYNISQLSKSYLFDVVISQRLKVFKKERKKTIEKCIIHRQPSFQFANKIFKDGICVTRNCNGRRCILSHFTEDTIFIPYCIACWTIIILKYTDILPN